MGALLVRSYTGMKRMASAAKKSSGRETSSKAHRARPRTTRFVVCVRNAGYEVSLERNEIYVVVPDAAAQRDGDLRIVDESGEDYLFSADRFVAVEVPAAVRASVLKIA
jgi:hypothetical protein